MDWLTILAIYYREKLELAKDASDRFNTPYDVITDYESHQDNIEASLIDGGITEQWIADNTATIKAHWEYLTDHNLIQDEIAIAAFNETYPEWEGVYKNLAD